MKPIMRVPVIATVVLCCSWITLSHAEIQQDIQNILEVAQDASQEQIEQAFIKLSKQFQPGGSWTNLKNQMEKSMDDITKSSESRRDKTQKREKEAGFKNYDGDEQQKEKSSSTQSLKTVSSSSYAHASSSYRDGEEPITHFSSGGSHDGGECTTVTERDGDSVSTQTACKSSNKDEL